jgi:hypothetical protein
MTTYQAGRNFGFDLDMDMEMIEHSKKRGEFENIFAVLRTFFIFSMREIFSSRRRRRSRQAATAGKFYRSPFSPRLLTRAREILFFLLSLHQKYRMNASCMSNRYEYYKLGAEELVICMRMNGNIL